MKIPNDSFESLVVDEDFTNMLGVNDTTETPSVICEISQKTAVKYSDPAECMISDMTETPTPNN